MVGGQALGDPGMGQGVTEDIQSPLPHGAPGDPERQPDLATWRPAPRGHMPPAHPGHWLPVA